MTILLEKIKKDCKDRKLLIAITGEKGCGMSYAAFTISRAWTYWRDNERQR